MCGVNVVVVVVVFFFLAFVYAKRFDDRYDKHTNRNVDIKTTNCHIVEGVSEDIQDIS